jgi:hypothetical protein
MENTHLLQLVLDGKKPGAFLDWMAWPYAAKVLGIDCVPMYWQPGDKEPDGVAVARAGTRVRDVIAPADIAFFNGIDEQGTLRSIYGQCRNKPAAAVLADMGGHTVAVPAPGIDRYDMLAEIVIGLLLGYPRCCVRDFAEVVHLGRAEHEFAEVGRLKNSLYSLCLECAREGRILYFYDRNEPTKEDHICEECQKCWDHPGRKCVYD